MAIGRVAAQLVHRSCADVPIGETRGDGGWWDGVGTPHANVSSWCLFREPRSRDSGGSEMPSPSEGPGFRIHSDPEGAASPRQGSTRIQAFGSRWGRWPGAVGADGSTRGWTSAFNGCHTADGAVWRVCGLAFLASRKTVLSTIPSAISIWETARETWDGLMSDSLPSGGSGSSIHDAAMNVSLNEVMVCGALIRPVYVLSSDELLVEYKLLSSRREPVVSPTGDSECDSGLSPLGPERPGVSVSSTVRGPCKRSWPCG